jgi:hypothetical protein
VLHRLRRLWQLDVLLRHWRRKRVTSEQGEDNASQAERHTRASVRYRRWSSCRACLARRRGQSKTAGSCLAAAHPHASP